MAQKRYNGAGWRSSLSRDGFSAAALTNLLNERLKIEARKNIKRVSFEVQNSSGDNDVRKRLEIYTSIGIIFGSSFNFWRNCGPILSVLSIHENDLDFKKLDKYPILYV